MCLSSWLFHVRETFFAHDVVSTVTIVGPKSCWHDDNLVDFSVNSGPWIWVSQLEKLGQRCAWTACSFVHFLIQQILMRHLLHACVAFGAEWTGRCTFCSPEAHVPAAEHKPLATPGRGGAGRQLANPARLSKHPLELRVSATERLSEMLVDWQPLCRKGAEVEIVVVKPRGHCYLSVSSHLPFVVQPKTSERLCRTGLNGEGEKATQSGRRRNECMQRFCCWQIQEGRGALCSCGETHGSESHTHWGGRDSRSESRRSLVLVGTPGSTGPSLRSVAEE